LLNARGLRKIQASGIPVYMGSGRPPYRRQFCPSLVARFARLDHRARPRVRSIFARSPPRAPNGGVGGR
jgi:hypothetical protein